MPVCRSCHLPVESQLSTFGKVGGLSVLVGVRSGLFKILRLLNYLVDSQLR